MLIHTAPLTAPFPVYLQETYQSLHVHSHPELLQQLELDLRM